MLLEHQMKSKIEEKFKEQNIYIKTTFSFIEVILDSGRVSK